VNVVLYVMNDCSHDARVIREARSLAGDGHRVTIVATTGPGQKTGDRTDGSGYEIVHVAVPRRWPLWYVWLKHPWRLARRAADEIASVRRRPRRLPHALGYSALAVVTTPWMAIRAAFDGVTHRLLRRPAGPGPLDYVLRWRAFHLAWARDAVRHAPAADVHHANDMDTLPAALAAARRDAGRVVYDSHEIYLESGIHARQPGWLRWWMRRWERSMAAGTEALVTINDVCAAELGRRLRPRRTVVVHNCPPRWTPPEPPEDRIRRAAGIAADELVVLCHGGFRAGRGLEETAAAMTRPGLERAHLVFLGYGKGVLEPIVAAFPDPTRVHVLPPVPPDEVLAWVAGADVDVMVLLAVELNHIVSTPNKLFESIAAGVPVVSSDFPARRAIICDDPAGALGAVCAPDDPDAIAAAIASILDVPPETRAKLRARCLEAAHARWNWETESARLVELYRSLEQATAGLPTPPTVSRG
jgi:glycosyltransferase involved in cell wall biosynthesis